jgi:two-component system NtrC family sensor kinase
MKRKLLIGLATVTVVLVTGNFFIVRSLNLIISHRSIAEFDEEIIDRYKEIEVEILEANLALYRHRAGEIKDLKGADLRIGILESKLEKNIEKDLETTARMEGELCEGCHDKNTRKQDEVRNSLMDIKARLREFHDLFLLAAYPIDAAGRDPKDDKIIARGTAIMEHLAKTKHSLEKMRDDIEKRTRSLKDRSKTTVFTILGISVFLVLLIFAVTIRAVTRPVDAFVKGIQSVKEGKSQEKLDIRSKDEIGYLAHEFNNMIDRLNEMYVEKNRTLAALEDFNARLEERVRDATVHLAEANRELKLAQEQMVRAETMAAIGTLSSGISHELSTPLSVILNMAQLMKQDAQDNPSLARDIEVIEYEANQAIKITRSMLGFSRSAKSKMEVANVNDVLEDLFKVLEFQPKARSIKLIKELDPDVAPIRAGAGQLRQVFLNIILNAVQAMPEGGQLRVASRNCRELLTEGVEISISDTGVGIPADHIKQIFQPFFTTKEEGTGLGLAITFGIIREHNGKIDVNSTEGKGSTFRIFLPKGAPQAVS